MPEGGVSEPQRLGDGKQLAWVQSWEDFCL